MGGIKTPRQPRDGLPSSVPTHAFQPLPVLDTVAEALCNSVSDLFCEMYSSPAKVVRVTPMPSAGHPAKDPVVSEKAAHAADQALDFRARVIRAAKKLKLFKYTTDDDQKILGVSTVLLFKRG
jgi:hypothetical protein